MVKAKKKRADKYDTKLSINGSFEDVIKVSVTPGKPAPAPKPVSGEWFNDFEGKLQLDEDFLLILKNAIIQKEKELNIS